MTGYLALYFGDRGATIELHQDRASAEARSDYGVREVEGDRFARPGAATPVIFTQADQAWRELRQLFGEV